VLAEAALVDIGASMADEYLSTQLEKISNKAKADTLGAHSETD
jgi:hypothetical protein